MQNFLHLLETSKTPGRTHVYWGIAVSRTKCSAAWRLYAASAALCVWGVSLGLRAGPVAVSVRARRRGPSEREAATTNRRIHFFTPDVIVAARSARHDRDDSRRDRGSNQGSSKWTDALY